MANGLDKLVAPGRHIRRPGRPGLRRVCVAALIMLVLQYGLGIFLNLYVAVPASDAHAGFLAEIATAPLALTVHALLGVVLIGTAILLVARAVSVRDRRLAVLSTAGLTAIGGAFGTGEIFVRNGQASASMAMAVLTGVALLCYVGTLALANAAQREAEREVQREAVREVRRQGQRPVQLQVPRQATGSWFGRE
jgi:heme A synthase